MKIIDLPTYISVRKKKEQRKYCPHNSIYVVDQFRTLECAHCQTIIDPFDYLVGLARKEDNFVYRTEELKEERASLDVEVNEKKKILKSLNGKITRRRVKLDKEKTP